MNLYICPSELTDWLCVLQVTAIVEKKCKRQAEFDKYKLYVDELEKVMTLLLKLSGRLARSENALMSLSEDATAEEKVGDL